MLPLLILAAAAATLPACATTRPEAAPPASAPPRAFADAVGLDNGRVRLEVSPAVGRVVHFGPVGGRNLLWVAPAGAATTPGADGQAYDNVGGDKLWPTSQALWEAATGNRIWPPDGVLDGAPWELVVADADRVVIRSPESDDYKLVVTREFRLEGAGARIRNTLLRTAANPFPVSAWTVTQVPMPRTALLDAAGDRPAGTPASRPLTPETPDRIAGRLGVAGAAGADAGAVAWEQAGPLHAKLGSFGRWVAAVYDDLTFLQRTAYDPAGGYLDASSVQVYRGEPYLELELWSPLAQLAPGEELSNEVVWELIEAPAERATAELLRRDAEAEAGR
ncbi:hypothetical protein PSMK_19050 [Phycisphaera mikurensis NBRC 102666]|uniref:DUF4380 domain-containing protein n=2 Tax=Phycisphaera TaxID=666508 RepID=I0IFM6_PHYMF|nr:hypothetical protein PSMK_19050 [Phycisphaera mikurensis NBRC 102666]